MCVSVCVAQGKLEKRGSRSVRDTRKVGGGERWWLVVPRRVECVSSISGSHVGGLEISVS